LLRQKITKIVAIRCHILRLKCAKFDFGWGSTRVAYSATPDSIVDLRGPTSNRKEWKGGERKGEEMEKKGGKRGREKKEIDALSLSNS